MSRATIWFGVVTLATCALVWFAAVSRLADHATAERVARSATRIQNPSAVAPALPESDAMTQLRSMALRAARSTLLTVRGN
jgi:hypothetical protein